MAAFSDIEFFNHEMHLGLHPGNDAFMQVHKRIADYILQFSPKTHLDVCAGNSPITEILLLSAVDAYAVEGNILSKAIFDTRNPDEAHRYVVSSVSNLFISLFKDKVFDVITSIEAFEHISDDVLLPLIYRICKRCKYFIFSSTPHRATPEFDEQWGHINIKTQNEWVSVFETVGFELDLIQTAHVQNNSIPTPWALVFKSNKFKI